MYEQAMLKPMRDSEHVKCSDVNVTVKVYKYVNM